MLVSFCFTIVFLVLENRKQQVINNIFLLIGQAITPLFLVGTFFLIIYMSIIIDVAIFNIVPLGVFNHMTITNGGIKGETATVALFVLKMFFNAISLIFILILNLDLYKYLFSVDEFISEAIGTQVNNNIMNSDKVVQVFKINRITG